MPSSLHDIYNPPPAPVPFEVTSPDPLIVTGADLAWLFVLCVLLVPVSAWGWVVDPMLGLGLTVVGLFVVLESWFSGLTFLRRHPEARPLWRGLIFLSSLAPWLLGGGLVAALMLGLFWVGDNLLGF